MVSIVECAGRERGGVDAGQHPVQLLELGEVDTETGDHGGRDLECPAAQCCPGGGELDIYQPTHESPLRRATD